MNPQIVFNFYLGAETSKSAEQIVAAVRSHLPAPTDAFAVHAETLPTPMDNTGESWLLPSPLDAMGTASAATSEGLPAPFDLPVSYAGLPEPTGASYPVTAPPPEPDEGPVPGLQK